MTTNARTSRSRPDYLPIPFSILLACCGLWQSARAASISPSWEHPPAQQREGVFWREHWYERGITNQNPGYERRLRVNPPEIMLHTNFGRRIEAREDGLMLIPALYIASPVDLLPDFIPFLGRMDDGLVFGLVNNLMVRFGVPATVLDEQLSRVESSRQR